MIRFGAIPTNDLLVALPVVGHFVRNAPPLTGCKATADVYFIFDLTIHS